MKAGDKVVCVDDGPSKSNNPLIDAMSDLPGGWVEKGQVYHINSIIPIGQVIAGMTCCEFGLVIAGKPVIIGGIESGWNPRRFRLVSEVGHPPVALAVPEEVGV